MSCRLDVPIWINENPQRTWLDRAGIRDSLSHLVCRHAVVVETDEHNGPIDYVHDYDYDYADATSVC